MRVPAAWQIDLSRLPGPLGKLGGKELHLWLGAWLKDRARKAANTPPPITHHLLFCLCDHYEPLHGKATSHETGLARVARWREEYPKLFDRFRDAEGRAPRHSYFFPGEQYDPRFIEPLGELAELGLGEVEVHLHHDRDTEASLKAQIDQTLSDLGRHGVLARKHDKFAWAFIHGNWCLANARRDGRHCGVDHEVSLLFDWGCYADFTFPAAPDESQPGVVNCIFYPEGDLRRRRAYEGGRPVRVGTPRRDAMLFVTGPIALSRRENRNSVRIESSAIDHTDAPTAARLRTWIDQRITVEGRPEWVFVKVHTHGAPERNADVLLGPKATAFHESLRAFNDGVRWKLHYVSAREMYNVARAAMDGRVGDPSLYFDYEIPPAERVKRV